MRNKPWAIDYLKEQPVVVLSPEEYKGNWKEVLKKDSIHLEIGSGKGDYWLKMSELYPEQGWIGVEKDKSVSTIAIKKVENESYVNKRFVVGDAELVENWFEEGEIDVIHLNFSDPWPKKRNAKRRLTHFRFLTSYDKILSDDGCIIMKTDNKSLFEYSLVQFSYENWLLEEVSVDFRSAVHDEDVMTEYETKFVSMGMPIYRAVWRKRKEST